MQAIEQTLDHVGGKYIYKNDPGILKDAWFVMRNQPNGFYYGDCEDFSLTVFWIMCNASLLAFVKHLLIGTYRLHFVTSNGNEGHCVGEFMGLYFDNWTKQALTRDEFLQRTGHSYRKRFSPPVVLCKLLVGLFYR